MQPPKPSQARTDAAENAIATATPSELGALTAQFDAWGRPETSGFDHWGSDKPLEQWSGVRLDTDIHKADANGWTPLMDACSQGLDVRARALIEAKAALDTQNNEGYTALMWACFKNHEQCARALIEAKADLEKQTAKGSTALIFACQHGHEHCARTLIEKGANINAKLPSGRTALDIARGKGHTAVCKLLEK